MQTKAHPRIGFFRSERPSDEIVDSAGTPLPKESILAVSPYDEEFGVTEKTSVLLVDSKLRKEYEHLHENIEQSKSEFSCGD